MARSFQQLQMVLSRARASALCSQWSFTISQNRFIRKEPDIQPWALHSQRSPRHRDETVDGKDELEDVEDKIQAVINEEMKRRKTVKYHIVRRHMTPRGPPERKLTWDAMEEIRYLKQEQPEEWTVERLAEGFSVSKDTICRVLRSKFAPSPERKAKQDTKVMANLKQQVLLSGSERGKQRLISSPTVSSSLTSTSVNSALISMATQSLMLQTEQNTAALSVVTKRLLPEITEHSNDVPQVEMQQSTEGVVEEVDEECWDGQVLSEEDIEELMTVKPTPVIKEGNEIFDVEGNFLYKI